MEGDELGEVVGSVDKDGFAVGLLEGDEETVGLKVGPPVGSFDTEGVAEGELVGLVLKDGSEVGS